MQMVDFKNKNGRLEFLDANQNFLFNEKILSQHNEAYKTLVDLIGMQGN